MQDPPAADHAETARPRGALRALVIVLGLIETAVFIAFVWVMLDQSDALSRSIGQALALVAAIPFCVLVLPGLGLAFANRHLRVALGLTLAVIPLVVAARYMLT